MDKRKKDIFVKGPISAQRIAESISKHSTKTEIGAHSIFLGQIRADQVEGKVVREIDYTAYAELALGKMHDIRELLFKKHKLSCMHVYHSLGRVKAGEICLFVFTSAAHRQAAIAACEELVEYIKTDMPIWGKEILEDDSHQWKINR